MVYSYRSAMARIAVLCGLSAVQLVASSWPEEFVQRYEAHGLALLHTNEFSAPMSLDSAAQRMLARSLSSVHLIYGVKWARCTEQQSLSPSL